MGGVDADSEHDKLRLEGDDFLPFDGGVVAAAGRLRPFTVFGAGIDVIHDQPQRRDRRPAGPHADDDAICAWQRPDPELGAEETGGYRLIGRIFEDDSVNLGAGAEIVGDHPDVGVEHRFRDDLVIDAEHIVIATVDLTHPGRLRPEQGKRRVGEPTKRSLGNDRLDRRCRIGLVIVDEDLDVGAVQNLLAGLGHHQGLRRGTETVAEDVIIGRGDALGGIIDDDVVQRQLDEDVAEAVEVAGQKIADLDDVLDRGRCRGRRRIVGDGGWRRRRVIMPERRHRDADQRILGIKCLGIGDL